MVRQVNSLLLLLIYAVVINGAEPGRKTTLYPVEQYLDSHGRTLSVDAVKAKLSPRAQHNKIGGAPQTLDPSAQQDDWLWTLKHVDDDAEFYMEAGGALDTSAVVFTPAAPCIVKEVYVQWYTAGNVVAYAADYSDAAEEVSPDGECSNIGHGSVDFSPIGTPRTIPTLNQIDGYHADWTYPLDIGGEFMVGDSTDFMHIPPFVIVLIKQGSTPDFLADNTFDRDSLTYTWFGGPWTNHRWGCYMNITDIMMMVKVTYPFVDDYLVQSVTQLPNTYSQTGPFSTYFDIMGSHGLDPDSLWNFQLHWTTNGQNEQLGDLFPEEVDGMGNGIYRAEITGEFSVNDQIEYWVTWQVGISGETIHHSFEIKTPANPYADILLIADGANQNQTDANLYGQALFDMGLVYQFWNTQTERGIDSSVVNFGWRNIIIFGWGNTTLAVKSNEYSWQNPNPHYDQFLDNGNRLALIDQDWLFRHGVDPDPVFNPGDFAYDYFGLTGATNDPVNADNVSITDTILLGADVTPIDSGFVNSPLQLNHAIYGTDNWGDYLIPSTATPIFTGANDGQCYGVINTDGNFHTVYLSFMADAAVDTLDDGTLVSPQFTELLQGIIHWFDTVGPTKPEQVHPTEFSLLPNYPNPFNPSTRIDFSVPEIEKVSISIYNLKGQLVSNLVNRDYLPGNYSIQWNGRDNTGKAVAAGTYFYKMEAGDFSHTRKMIYLK